MSCKQDSHQLPVVSETTTKKPTSPAPSFSADSAFDYTRIQVAFGPRAMNTKSHDECGNYLVWLMKQFADTVYVQRGQVKGWDRRTLSLQNVIGSFNPEAKKRVLLASHWDSRPWADQDTARQKEPIEGANDGAAGVGILLEIARQLKAQRPDIGVDIIFFDAEDYGQPEDSGLPEVKDSWCLGSQYWARNPHVMNYSASLGVLLDMVAAENAVYTQEAYSVEYANDALAKVWSTAAKIGYSDRFVYDKSHPITDDHFYVNMIAHVPCIDIIQNDPTSNSRFYKNWHTHQDVLKYINKPSMSAVGQTLLEVIYNEN